MRNPISAFRFLVAFTGSWLLAPAPWLLSMKGPSERLKYDLRRLWECPACQRRERTPGTVTSRFCGCATRQPGGGKPVPMKLIADGPQRLVPVIVARPSPDEVPAPPAPSFDSAEIAALPPPTEPPEAIP
jgi:hypothetical protein